MSLADEIKKLEELYKSGAMTEREFTLAKEQLLKGELPTSNPGPSALHTFRRSAHDYWLGGVCGGLGEHTQIPSWCWRILFCSAVLFLGFGIVLYILIWIFAPPPESSSS